MLSGELHNSTSSNLDYMNQHWANLKATGLNSVVTPLSWELVEPKEGSFDFALVDGLLDQARRNNEKIVFLWLASWKNGQAGYKAVSPRHRARQPGRNSEPAGSGHAAGRRHRLRGADEAHQGGRQQ